MELVRVQVDKTSNSHVYAKTTMCRYIMGGKKCLLGDECTYAHNEYELQMPLCKYRENCNFAYRNGEKLTCISCKFRHPEIGWYPQYNIAQPPVEKIRTPVFAPATTPGFSNYIEEAIVVNNDMFPPLASTKETFATILSKKRAKIQDNDGLSITLTVTLKDQKSVSAFLKFIKQNNITEIH